MVEIATIHMEVAPAVAAIQETTEEATTSNLHTGEVGVAGIPAVDAATMIITDSSTIEVTPFYIYLIHTQLMKIIEPSSIWCHQSSLSCCLRL